MHYFSPVPKMPLLEIILHQGTAPEVAAAAMEVGSRQGKTPVFVKDVPGFFVNRCLSPFMVEVSALVAEGVNIELIDKSMKKFGMPVGPITLSGKFISHLFL
jgi:enoyl-CoA hydratase / long-chain 3-hydroxyacyl-CoA dehydrogenase